MSNSDEECLANDPELAAMFTDGEDDEDDEDDLGTHAPRGRRQPDNNRNNIKSSKLKQNIGKLFNFGSMRKSIKRSGWGLLTYLLLQMQDFFLA